MLVGSVLGGALLEWFSLALTDVAGGRSGKREIWGLFCVGASAPTFELGQFPPIQSLSTNHGLPVLRLMMGVLVSDPERVPEGAAGWSPVSLFIRSCPPSTLASTG